MEESDLLKLAGVSTTGVAIVLILYRVGKSLLGKKLVSHCCGKRFDVGIDVADMKSSSFKIENPMTKNKDTIDGTTNQSNTR